MHRYWRKMPSRLDTKIIEDIRKILGIRREKYIVVFYATMSLDLSIRNCLKVTCFHKKRSKWNKSN